MKTFSEIINEIQHLSFEDKVNTLKRHIQANPQVGYVLRAGLDPAIKWRLPAGVPPFKKNKHPVGMTTTNIIKAINGIIIFTNLGPNIDPKTLEHKFIGLLEELDEAEATMLCKIKDKSIPGLDLRIYEAVTNGILPPPAPATEPTPALQPSDIDKTWIESLAQYGTVSFDGATGAILFKPLMRSTPAAIVLGNSGIDPEPEAFLDKFNYDEDQPAPPVPEKKIEVVRGRKKRGSPATD